MDDSTEAALRVIIRAIMEGGGQPAKILRGDLYVAMENFLVDGHPVPGQEVGRLAEYARSIRSHE